MAVDPKAILDGDRRALARAITLIESGRVPLAKMHTHDFALADAERAIRTLAGEIPGEPSIHCCLLPWV